MILTESIIGEYLDVLSRRHVRNLTGSTVKQSSDLVLDLIALSFQTQVL